MVADAELALGVCERKSFVLGVESPHVLNEVGSQWNALRAFFIGLFCLHARQPVTFVGLFAGDSKRWRRRRR